MGDRDDDGESARPAQPGADPAPWPGASGAADAPGGGRDGLPRCAPEDDFDADAEMARWVADLEAGRERIPEERETGGSAVSLSLGDACDLDPALLAAILGPDGPGGQSLSPVFGQDQAADALRPGPALAALTEQAVADLAVLSDDQLAGALRAELRLENRSACLQTLTIAEYARRRAAQREDARARKAPPGRRPGEFPADELAMELVSTGNWADTRIDHDLALAARLPRTLAGMAAGRISGARADIIAGWTASLTDADAARADEILAAAAPGLRYDQLARRAAALELKLNPDGVKARREHARQTRQRVELRREDSGNASLAGRELDTLDALASKAYIDALAVRIRNHGHADGPLETIRARVMTELLQGRNPLGLLKPRPRPGTAAGPGAAETPPDVASDGNGIASDGNDGRPDGDADGARDGTHGGGARLEGEQRGGAEARDPDDPGPDYPGDLDPGDLDGYDGPGDLDPDDPGHGDDFGPGYAGPDGAPAWTDDEAENARYTDPDDPAQRRGPLRPSQSAPPPANLNLTIPIGTLLGWSTAPAQAGGFGLLDPDETRALAAAASKHPRTRWSITLINPDGHAIAHGRARGQHPWNPPPPQPPPATPPRGTSPPPPDDGPPRDGSTPRSGARGPDPAPDADQAARLRHLIQALNIIFDPIAQHSCDHRGAEDRYTPSRKLKDVIRARTITCDAPGCNAQAVYCDLDHTLAYPDGPTCQCNLSPKCRRHHRAKQAPGWNVEQPQPGIVRWTLPNGRTHTTTPTTYDS